MTAVDTLVKNLVATTVASRGELGSEVNRLEEEVSVKVAVSETKLELDEVVELLL